MRFFSPFLCYYAQGTNYGIGYLVAAIRVGITVEVVVPILKQITVILGQAVHCIQEIIINPKGSVLFYAGRILALHEVAEILATLLKVCDFSSSLNCLV